MAIEAPASRSSTAFMKNAALKPSTPARSLQFFDQKKIRPLLAGRESMGIRGQGIRGTDHDYWLQWTGRYYYPWSSVPVFVHSQSASQSSAANFVQTGYHQNASTQDEATERGLST